MKKTIILILLTWILSSCSDNINIETNKNISNNNQVIEQKVEKKEVFNLKTVWVKEFKQEIAKKDWILIDLRTPEELTWFVINNPDLNLDYYSKNFKEKLNSLDKNKKYLIYCRSWHRSWETLKLMKKFWFKNVINLKGWIISWANAWEKLSKYKK